MTDVAALEVVTKLAEATHANSTEKGFWSIPDSRITEISTKLLLIVTEVAEAEEVLRERYEGPVRMHTRMSEKQESDFLFELVDILIRTFDLAEALFPGQLAAALVAKMETNTKRPNLHGKRL